MVTPIRRKVIPAVTESLTGSRSNGSHRSNSTSSLRKSKNKQKLENYKNKQKENNNNRSRSVSDESGTVGASAGDCNKSRHQKSVNTDLLIQNLQGAIEQYEGMVDARAEAIDDIGENGSDVVVAVQPLRVKDTTNELEPEWSCFLAEVEAHLASGSPVPALKMIPRIFNKVGIVHNIENRQRAINMAIPQTHKEVTFRVNNNPYTLLKLLMLNVLTLGPIFIRPTPYDVFAHTILSCTVPLNIWFIVKKLTRRNFQRLAIESVDYLLDYCPKEHVGYDLHHSAKITPVVGANMHCEARCYPVGFTIAKYALWIPRLCCHSELVALTRRQCLPAISDKRTRESMWNRAVEILPRCFFNICPEEEPDFYDWVRGRYSMRETERLTSVYEDYQRLKPLDQIDDPFYYNKGFVKREKLCSKVEKRFPRFISSTPDLYKVLTAPGCTVFFDALKAVDWRVSGLFIAAGLNGAEIGAFCTLMENLGFEAYPGDYSKYDGHIEVEALKAEIAGYERCGLWKPLIRLLRLQQFTKGRTKNYKFTFRGKRGSGVGNTSLGNCFLNYLITLITCKHLRPGVDWVIMVNGDDFILFLTYKHSDIVPVLLVNATKMGHSLTMATQSISYDRLEFCSQYFWNVGSSHSPCRVLGPKPFRTLAKTFTPAEEMDSAILKPWIREVLIGYEVYSFVPVLGKIVAKTLKKIRHAHYKTLPTHLLVKMRKEQAYKIGVNFVLPGTADEGTLNDQFYTIYGYPVTALQELIEVDFSATGMLVTGEILDHCLDIDGVDNSYNSASLYASSRLNRTELTSLSDQYSF